MSGFQSGVDIAGIRAAAECGIPTSGWMPRHFKTEDGNHPEYAELYGAKEHPSPDYPTRTEWNVRDSDVTLWFGADDSRGYGCTIGACRRLGKPFIRIVDPSAPELLADTIREKGWKTVNVAGNRESSRPGIGARVERFLVRVFELAREG